MSRKILFAIVAILLDFSGARAAEESLRLAPGESAMIVLRENPSTGYRWRVDREASSDLSILRIGDDGFATDGGERNPALVGAPGVHRWTVEALARGRARIEFVSERPWEKRPIERHGVTVVVGEGE